MSIIKTVFLNKKATPLLPLEFNDMTGILYSSLYKGTTYIEAYRYNLISLFFILNSDLNYALKLITCDAKAENLMSSVMLLFGANQASYTNSNYSGIINKSITTSNTVLNNNVVDFGDYSFVQIKNSDSRKTELLKSIKKLRKKNYDILNITSFDNFKPLGMSEFHIRYINQSILNLDYPQAIINLILYTMFIDKNNNSRDTEVSNLLNIFTNQLDIVDTSITIDKLKESLICLINILTKISSSFVPTNECDENLNTLCLLIKDTINIIKYDNKYNECLDILINFLECIIHTANDYIKYSDYEKGKIATCIWNIFMS